MQQATPNSWKLSIYRENGQLWRADIWKNEELLKATVTRLIAEGVKFEVEARN